MIIWLASYPRSGNTWLRVILNHAFGIRTCSIYGENSAFAKNQELRAAVGIISFDAPTDIAEMRKAETSYYVKTHELAHIHLTSEDKIIYVIRDGRMSTASYYHYLRSRAPDLHIDLETIVAGKTNFGSWAEHVKSWESVLNRENSIFIRYEDLVQSLDDEIEKIGRFVGVKRRVADVPKLEDLRKLDPSFFSLGAVRNFNDDFTEEKHFLYWLKSYQVMKRYGYLSEMPDYFADESNQGVLTAAENYGHFLELALQKAKSHDKKPNLALQETKSLKKEIEILKSKIKLLQGQTALWRRFERFSLISYLKSKFK